MPTESTVRNGHSLKMTGKMVQDGAGMRLRDPKMVRKAAQENR